MWGGGEEGGSIWWKDKANIHVVCVGGGAIMVEI